MAVETNTLTTSGKYSLNSNWSLAVKPSNKHFAVIPTAKEAKVEAAAVAAALEVVGTMTGAAFALTIGGTEAQAENIALKVAAAATFSGPTNPVKFNTTAVPRLTIDYGGKTTPHTIVLEAGKYKLVSALTPAGNQSLKVEKSADLDTAEKTLELVVEVLEKGTLTFTNSKVILSMAGTVWNAGSEATLTSTGSTIEVTSTAEAEKAFEGGGLKYGALKLPGVNIAVNQANHFTGTVTVSNGVNKPAVGKGARFQKSVKQILEAAEPIAFTGKAGEVSRLESSEAGKQAELEATAGTGDYERTEVVAVKDINWTRGTLYLPNAESIEGCTKVVKEAKPAGGVTAVGVVSSGATVASPAQRIAQVAPTATAGATVSVSVRRVAQVAANVTAGASASAAGKRGVLLGPTQAEAEGYATTIELEGGRGAAVKALAAQVPLAAPLRIEEIRVLTGAGPHEATSVEVGIYDENFNLLGSAVIPGTPPTNSWITASGLGILVPAGTTPRLAVIALGTAGAKALSIREAAAAANTTTYSKAGTTFASLPSGSTNWPGGFSERLAIDASGVVLPLVKVGPVRVSGGGGVTATVKRLAATAASITGGATVSSGTAPPAGKRAGVVSGGIQTNATVARVARAGLALSSGVSAQAKAFSVRRAPASAVGGAVVTATVRRVARIAVRVTSGALAGASGARPGTLKARVSGGFSVSATWTAYNPTIEPPTATPVAGHVAVGSRGTMGGHVGRIPSGNIGRAER